MIYNKKINIFEKIMYDTYHTNERVSIKAKKNFASTLKPI